ncbi:hypothetical protein [Legionella maioricensis]|uniref:Uncharacterized protein n=1 Tax=Legionella maioricensis TaxID=2896528 RepID=A0A9X2IEB7_9GAMM|nr:hypothetical protein [Legionella maioricensis]MCL9685658.1 hypothetical protein [Legionella maioricensis]MCL9689076.1 hypothetical protein [Legionella maioricensis]
MHFSIKQILVAATMGFLSLSAYAESGESFQTVCINSWMKKIGDSADKVDFKNFGEKYCTCAAGQPLDNEAAIQKAIQLCLSRTLLHDAMDSLEEEVGLSEAKDTDINEYCEDRWNLIYPKQTDEDKKATTAYCECAKPKLMDLIKKAENMTDKEYDDGINDVAAACSGNVKQETPTTATTTTTSTTPAPTAPASTTPEKTN